MRRNVAMLALLPGFALAAVLALPACTPPRPSVALAEPDAGEVRDIAAALDGVQRLQADFVQSGDLGAGNGTIWLDRPGRLRIDYAGPDSSVMVANAGRLTVLDRHTRAVTTMAVSRTPLGILLAPVIDLAGDVTVLDLRHQAGLALVTLRRTASPRQGTLTLALTQHPWALRSVSVTDARGRTLTMQLSALRRDPVLTPELFAAPSS